MSRPVPTYHYQGREWTFDELAAIAAVKRGTLRVRLYDRRRWTVERAVTEPKVPAREAGRRAAQKPECAVLIVKAEVRRP